MRGPICADDDAAARLWLVSAGVVSRRHRSKSKVLRTRAFSFRVEACTLGWFLDIQPRAVTQPVIEGVLMDRLRASVALPWILAVIGFPIGGFLAQAIAGGRAQSGTSGIRAGRR